MPGIVGIIRKHAHDGFEHELDSMIDALRHHDSLVHGSYVDEQLGLGVGWVNHPDSFSEPLPVQSRKDGTLLFFHGEHFPRPDLTARYCRSGLLSASGGAEGLIELYEQTGADFLRELNGWFAGLLVNPITKEITLFNDRYGVSRVYVVETADEFLFASEAKALLRIRPGLRSLDQDALSEHLRYNCVLGNHTLYSGIRTLPGGAAWRFNGGIQPEKNQYFNFREWEGQEPLPAAEFFDRWCEVISDVFQVYATGGEKVALSLTAGMDTRLIMAALGEGCRAHPAYTFGGAWGELYDVSTARRAAAVYGQDFSVIPIDRRFFEGFEDYAKRAVYISDGTYDACGAHDVFFNEAARHIAPIRLTGKFGSEVVRIRSLIPSRTYERGLLDRDLEAQVLRLPTYQATNSGGHRLTRVVTEEIAWHEYSKMVVEQTFLPMRTPYMDNRLIKLMYQAPHGIRETGDLQEDYVKQFAPEFARFITNLGRFASNSNFLTKLAYYPYRAQFKAEYIYLYATPHWITRIDRLCERWRPERIFSGRQKWEGYRLWMKTHFADFLRDTLLRPGAGYTNHFNYKAVNKMVNEHVAGTHNHFDPINRALSMQLLYETLLES